MCGTINGIKKLAAALIATELKKISPKVKHVADAAAATARHNIYLHSIEAIKLRRQHQFQADGPHYPDMSAVPSSRICRKVHGVETQCMHLPNIHCIVAGVLFH